VKLLQESERKLSSIRMPGDWEKGLDAKKVEALKVTIQEVIKQHGREEAPKHMPFGPVCLDQGDRLVYGRHRYAASRACSLTSIRSAKYEFSGPREVRITELRENLDRRQLSAEETDRATKELVELLTAEEAESDAVSRSLNSVENSQGASRPGPKKTPESRAVERVSDATGISPQGVRARVERAKEKDAPAAKAAPTIEVWGLRTDDPAMMATIEDAARIQKAMDAVSAACARAVAAINEGLPNTAQWSAAANLREELHSAGRVARALRPAALCPFCKDVVNGCPSCDGRGVVGQGEMERAPDELKLGGDQAMVCVGPGELVPLAKAIGLTFGARKTTSKNGKGTNGKTKKNRIVMASADGTETPFVPESEPEAAADEDGYIPF
jgi:hypothetical protein